ncbi:hypothetical protein BX600DRAFT_553712 [Xylariales sp. PMI_506]|nr:hypothetical protein BX600DRAFT_553712 [Xylariales sp. PMI_506]
MTSSTGLDWESILCSRQSTKKLEEHPESWQGDNATLGEVTDLITRLHHGKALQSRFSFPDDKLLLPSTTRVQMENRELDSDDPAHIQALLAKFGRTDIKTQEWAIEVAPGLWNAFKNLYQKNDATKSMLGAFMRICFPPFPAGRIVYEKAVVNRSGGPRGVFQDLFPNVRNNDPMIIIWTDWGEDCVGLTSGLEKPVDLSGNHAICLIYDAVAQTLFVADSIAHGRGHRARRCFERLSEDWNDLELPVGSRPKEVRVLDHYAQEDSWTCGFRVMETLYDLSRRPQVFAYKVLQNKGTVLDTKLLSDVISNYLGLTVNAADKLNIHDSDSGNHMDYYDAREFDPISPKTPQMIAASALSRQSDHPADGRAGSVSQQHAHSAIRLMRSRQTPRQKVCVIEREDKSPLKVASSPRKPRPESPMSPLSARAARQRQETSRPTEGGRFHRSAKSIATKKIQSYLNYYRHLTEDKCGKGPRT